MIFCFFLQRERGLDLDGGHHVAISNEGSPLLLFSQGRHQLAGPFHNQFDVKLVYLPLPYSVNYPFVQRTQTHNV